MSENKITNEEELWSVLDGNVPAAPKSEAKPQKSEGKFAKPGAPRTKVDGFFLTCMAGVAAVSVAATLLITSLTGGSSPAPAAPGKTETVPAGAGANLAITKSISPAQVVDNDRVTYTFLIQNTGNQAVIATDDAAIADTFDPILTDLAVSFNGTALTEGTDYTYDETTGAFATLPGVIAVPAATYVQDSVTGEWTVTPGNAYLTIVGTI